MVKRSALFFVTIFLSSLLYLIVPNTVSAATCPPNAKHEGDTCGKSFRGGSNLGSCCDEKGLPLVCTGPADNMRCEADKRATACKKPTASCAVSKFGFDPCCGGAKCTSGTCKVPAAPKCIPDGQKYKEIDASGKGSGKVLGQCCGSLVGDFKGFCRKDSSSRDSCNCDKANDPAKNGYKCNNPITGKRESFNCPAKQSCSEVSDPDKYYTDKGANIRAYGITCGKPTIQCKCIDPGSSDSGANKIECTMPDGTKQYDFCEDNQICEDSPDASLELSGAGPFNGYVLKKVACRDESKDPQKKPLPPPPSPPCIHFDPTSGKCTAVLTAFGAFSTNPSSFTVQVFGIVLSISGGIALLLIIRAGYRIMTSQGQPEALKQGREQLVAAIVGLMFLIFSFVILEVIGVDLLKIPGLTGAGAVPSDHCNNSCQSAAACTARGGKSRGVLDCTGGSICCE